MELVIAFFAGAIGGNFAGWAFSKRRIGLLTSTLIGAFGGGLLFVVINTMDNTLLTAAGAATGYGSLLSLIAMGIGGGGVAFVLLGWIAPQVQKTHRTKVES